MMPYLLQLVSVGRSWALRVEEGYQVMTIETGTDEGSDEPRLLRADARRNRARVMEAVWRLLATRSPEELSMEEVAREADIGKGTLYRHYPNKECLFEALIHDGVDQIKSGMRDRIPPEADAPTKLRALVALVYDAYEDHHLSVDLLLSTRLRDSIAASREPEHPIAALLTRLRAILEQGVREGAFRALDLDYAATALFSLIGPIAFVKQRERLGYTRADLERLTMDMMLHALCVKAPRGF